MSKTERQKASCYVCGRIGHMAKDSWFKNTNKVNTTKDCWFKDTSESGLPSNKYRKGKGKGKRKGKNSVKEIATPTESTVTPTGGTTKNTSQIWRITQNDTWDHPHTQNSDEEYKTGYISATIQYRKPPHQSEDWHAIRILVDNCADEQVCSRKTSSGLKSSQAGIPIGRQQADTS